MLHEISYALTGHVGDWREGGVAWEAASLNAPILTFQAERHAGPLGRSFSVLRPDSSDVAVMALKKAEESDDLVLRVRELSGRSLDGARISASLPLIAADEVTGQEQLLGPADLVDNQLVLDLSPYRPRAFALRPAARTGGPEKPEENHLRLPYNVDAVSYDWQKGDGSLVHTRRVRAVDSVVSLHASVLAKPRLVHQVCLLRSAGSC